MVTIPGYTIQRELGHGGMATVYLALQDSLQRPVALKVMAPALAADRTFSERFLREGRTVGQLSHPHIVSVFDIGVVEHCHYIAMEYVPDGDLKSRLQGGIPVDPRQAMVILRQMAQALSYAHGRGFVHRDVKPENILFRVDGEAVLSDFGIAKSLTGGTRMTGTGMSIGTPHYMSPEQARGKTVDGRADFYSLGVVFYEMLIGRVPYDADDSLAIGIKHISEQVPELPADVQRYQPLVDRLLAKDPDQRVQNAEDLCMLIERLERGDNAHNFASATRVMPKIGQSDVKKLSAFKWGIGGAIAAGLLASGLYYWKHTQQPITAGGGISVASSHSSQKVRLSDPPLISITDEPEGTPITLEENILQQKKVTTDTENGIDANDSTKQVTQVEGLSVTSAMATSEIEADAESVKQKRIQALLNKAQENIAQWHLTTPDGDNAFDKYQLVLKIDPGNIKAQKGLENIVSLYLDLADKYIRDNSFNKAKNYIDRASQVGEKSNRIAIIRTKLDNALYSFKEKKILNNKNLISIINDSPKKTVDNGLRFDFYTIRPESEVAIPNYEIKTRIREERAGKSKSTHYMMQAGTFRSYQEADKFKNRLALIGVQSKIEKVKVGKSIWNRIKIGPFSKMSSVNKIRTLLKENHIDAVVMEIKGYKKLSTSLTSNFSISSFIYACFMV